MNIIRDTNTVILAVWALLLGSGLVALLLGQWSMAFVALFTLTLSLTPPLLASRYSLKLPMPFLVATTLFFIGSILLGEAFDFYERLWWWDLALHGASAIGFGLFGFLFVFMLFEGDRFAAPPSAIAFITFCVAMTVGAVWEIFEYGMDNIFGLNMQKSGLDDTMGDIMVDALGAFIASTTGYLYLKERPAGVLSRLLSAFIDRNRSLYQKYRQTPRK